MLTTSVTDAEGKITANITAISDMTSRDGDAETAIDGLNESVAENGLAMANGFQQLRAQVGDVQSSITSTNQSGDGGPGNRHGRAARYHEYLCGGFVIGGRNAGKNGRRYRRQTEFALLAEGGNE